MVNNANPCVDRTEGTPSLVGRPWPAPCKSLLHTEGGVHVHASVAGWGLLVLSSVPLAFLAHTVMQHRELGLPLLYGRLLAEGTIALGLLAVGSWLVLQ